MFTNLDDFLYVGAYNHTRMLEGSV
jgi:hypothetical protein